VILIFYLFSNKTCSLNAAILLYLWKNQSKQLKKYELSYCCRQKAFTAHALFDLDFFVTDSPKKLWIFLIIEIIPLSYFNQNLWIILYTTKDVFFHNGKKQQQGLSLLTEHKGDDISHFVVLFYANNWFIFVPYLNARTSTEKDAFVWKSARDEKSMDTLSKNRLQEYCMKNKFYLPNYRIRRQSGPQHSLKFQVIPPFNHR
jgi:hypothetical protein